MPTTTYPTGDGLNVDTVAKAQYEAIKNKLTEHGWIGRQELHKKIVDGTIGNLSAKYGDGYVSSRARVVVVSCPPLWSLIIGCLNLLRYTFYALAFLPYNQESQHCVESFQTPDGGKLIDASQANLNFFIRYVPKNDKEYRSKLNRTWQAIKSQRSAILGNVL